MWVWVDVPRGMAGQAHPHFLGDAATRQHRAEAVVLRMERPAGEIPGALAFDDRERAQPQGAGRARGGGRSESTACFIGTLLMWVYFRSMSEERWPVRFIRISSETPAFANAVEKLWRREWNVRRATLRDPLPFTAILALSPYYQP